MYIPLVKMFLFHVSVSLKFSVTWSRILLPSGIS